MAYFFDKIKTVTLTGNQNQTITFNNASAPTFQAGSVSFGSLVTTGAVGESTTSISINRPFIFNTNVNFGGTVAFGGTGSEISFSPGLNVIFNPTVEFSNVVNLSGSSPINAAGRNLSVATLNNMQIVSSVANRRLDLFGNLTIGASNRASNISISSNTSSAARELILSRNITFTSASARTLVFNSSTTEISSITAPSQVGEYTLIQKNIIGGGLQNPEWISREPKIEYTGLRGLEAVTTENQSVLFVLEGYSRLLFKYLRNGQKVRTFTGPSSLNFLTRFISNGTTNTVYTIHNIDYSNFTFQLRDSNNNILNARSGTGVDVAWGFDVETRSTDTYDYTINTSFKKITVRLLECFNITGNDWKLRRRVVTKITNVFYNLGSIVTLEEISFYNTIGGSGEKQIADLSVFLIVNRQILSPTTVRFTNVSTGVILELVQEL